MLTRKLGRKKAHRSHMLRNLAASVILHESVETTEAKAKEVKKLVESSISLAKKNNLAARRQLAGLFFDNAAVDKLMSDLGPRYAPRTSGFTRTVRTGVRHGDGMSKMLISLIPAEKPVEKTQEKSDAK